MNALNEGCDHLSEVTYPLPVRKCSLTADDQNVARNLARALFGRALFGMILESTFQLSVPEGGCPPLGDAQILVASAT